MSENGRALAQQKLNTLNELLQKHKKEIIRALPNGIEAERIIRQTVTLASQNPRLLDCTSVSVASGLMKAAELGLELSGVLGQAYLVPYYNSQRKQLEATFQVGYRGMLSLAYRSGKVDVVEARVVQAGDIFRVRLGTERTIEHEPCFKDGEPTHYYAVMSMVGGGKDIEVMSVRQIEAHRDRYSKAYQKDKDKGPWVEAFDEQAKKTVLRRMLKRSPVSVQLARAVALDELAEADLPQPEEQLIEGANDEPLLVEENVATQDVAEKIRSRKEGTKEAGQPSG